jgi:hypothetical protein
MVIKAIPGKWEFHGGDIFYNPRKVELPTQPVDVLKRFGFTMKEIVIELFRINRMLLNAPIPISLLMLKGCVNLALTLSGLKTLRFLVQRNHLT